MQFGIIGKINNGCKYPMMIAGILRKKKQKTLISNLVTHVA